MLDWDFENGMDGIFLMLMLMSVDEMMSARYLMFFEGLGGPERVVPVVSSLWWVV